MIATQIVPPTSRILWRPPPRRIVIPRRHAIGQRIGQLPVAFTHRRGNPAKPWTLIGPQPFRAWQTDFGLTIGSTLKLTGTSPAMTVTGAAATSVAIRVEIQTTGAIGASTLRYSADGGATFIQSGVVTAATIACTGALAGVTLNLPAGTYTAGDFYRGTVSAWLDQIASQSLLQATAASQPVTQIGLNGHVSLLGDGVATKMTDTSVDLPAPGTTPTLYWYVLRQITWTAGRVWMGAGNAATSMAVFQTVASPQVVQFDGSSQNANSGAALNSWVRGETLWNNNVTVNDYNKLAATKVATGNSGNTDPAVNFNLFADAPASGFSNIEVMAVYIYNQILSQPQLDVLSAAATALWGGSLGV